MNWIEDLYWKQLDLNYPGMDDAMVCIAEACYEFFRGVSVLILTNIFILSRCTMDFIMLTTTQLYALQF
jgi:hypothetical protein